ncbi:hypothetical protein ILYODFUR_020158 [Ilyodon furcidens]|uniref:Uncharacterized protein n=1 Tax=Ilyodon furcidens TaxID=33524 RepID=A0ABV0SPI8_9TELE
MWLNQITGFEAARPERTGRISGQSHFRAAVKPALRVGAWCTRNKWRQSGITQTEVLTIRLEWAICKLQLITSSPGCPHVLKKSEIHVSKIKALKCLKFRKKFLLALNYGGPKLNK